MRTSDVAKQFDVHPNTVRLYEEWGFIPPVPRDASGYRRYSDAHLAHMRLARCALGDSPPSGSQLTDARKEILWLASAGDLALAVRQARKYQATVTRARERAEDALTHLHGMLPPYIAQYAGRPLLVRQAAAFADVSVPVLRRWEQYRLLQVPRSSRSNYRQYGANELGWLLVIQSLRLAGYTVTACRRLFNAHPQHGTPVSPDPLTAAIRACIALFSRHEAHARAILDCLLGMTPE